MKYMGSKNRIAKYILPIILKDRKENQTYVEPFLGGANSFDKVSNPRLGSDSDLTAITALIQIRDRLDSIPRNNTEFSEEQYKEKEFSYAAFALSYGGKKWGGWRRDKEQKRDYVEEAYKNAKNQSKSLQGSQIINRSYLDLNIPENSIIYCDPPYEGTTKYSNKFNHKEFWEWCRVKIKEGHKVFVSEYSCPEDFVCVWEKELASSLTKDTGSKKAIERLFIHRSQIEAEARGTHHD